uniref:Transposase n=1 Tax=Syphacia muris TaxID=451379 RepID=A0A0N5B149_9BILA
MLHIRTFRRALETGYSKVQKNRIDTRLISNETLKLSYSFARISPDRSMKQEGITHIPEKCIGSVIARFLHRQPVNCNRWEKYGLETR